MNDHHAHHHFSYNEEERRTRQNPEKILMEGGLNGGMVLLDLGCNDGFFTLPASQIVGDKGKIFAVDTNQKALETMSIKLHAQRRTNVTTMLSTAEQATIETGIADMVFLGIVLHDFSDSLKVVKNAYRWMKPGATILNLDWQKKRTDSGPPYDIRFSKAKATSLLREAGFTILSTSDYSSDYYIIKARKELPTRDL